MRGKYKPRSPRQLDALRVPDLPLTRQQKRIERRTQYAALLRQRALTTLPPDADVMTWRFRS